VAEHGPRAAGQDRGHPAALERSRRVADGVHARPLDVEATVGDPVLDRPPADAQPHELPTGDAPVLPRGEPRDQGVDRTRVQSAPYDVVVCTRVSHAPRMPGQM